MTPLLWALPKNRLSFLCAETRLPQNMRGASDRRSGFWTGPQHNMLTVWSTCPGMGLFRIAHRIDPSSPRPPPRSESTKGLALQHRLESGEYRAAGPVCPATARHHVNMAVAALIVLRAGHRPCAVSNYQVRIRESGGRHRHEPHVPSAAEDGRGRRVAAHAGRVFGADVPRDCHRLRGRRSVRRIPDQPAHARAIQSAPRCSRVLRPTG